MATLGDMLHAARDEQGITLTDLSKITNIRLGYLSALEKGDFESLPAPGYVRQFINSYARAVRQEPSAFLHQYEIEMGLDYSHPHMDRPIQAVEAVKPKNEQHTINWRIALIISGAIALIAVVIWLALLVSHRKQEVTPAPVTPASVATTTTTKTTKTTTVSTAGKPFELILAASEGAATQVAVTIDGEKTYDGVLTGSNKLTYEVSKKAVVTAASPDKLVIKRDGATVEDTADAGKAFVLKATE